MASKSDPPFLLNTKTACFLCLKECECSNSNKLFSFRTISRYFKINLDNQLGSSYALLCSECFQEQETFTKLYRELEVVKMKISSCLRKVYEVMMEANRDKDRMLRYKEIILPERNCQVGFVESLRDEIMAKCALEVRDAVPRVRLRKLSEARSRPAGEEIISEPGIGVVPGEGESAMNADEATLKFGEVDTDESSNVQGEDVLLEEFRSYPEIEVEQVEQSSDRSPSEGPFFFEEDLEGVEVEDNEGFMYQIMGLSFSEPSTNCCAYEKAKETRGQRTDVPSCPVEKMVTEETLSECSSDDDDEDDPLSAYAKALEKLLKKREIEASSISIRGNDANQNAEVELVQTEPSKLDDRLLHPVPAMLEETSAGADGDAEAGEDESTNFPGRMVGEANDLPRTTADLVGTLGVEPSKTTEGSNLEPAKAREVLLSEKSLLLPPSCSLSLETEIKDRSGSRSSSDGNATAMEDDTEPCTSAKCKDDTIVSCNIEAVEVTSTPSPPPSPSILEAEKDVVEAGSTSTEENTSTPVSSQDSGIFEGDSVSKESFIHSQSPLQASEDYPVDNSFLLDATKATISKESYFSSLSLLPKSHALRQGQTKGNVLEKDSERLESAEVGRSDAYDAAKPGIVSEASSSSAENERKKLNEKTDKVEKGSLLKPFNLSPIIGMEEKESKKDDGLLECFDQEAGILRQKIIENQWCIDGMKKDDKPETDKDASTEVQVQPSPQSPQNRNTDNGNKSKEPNQPNKIIEVDLPSITITTKDPSTAQEIETAPPQSELIISAVVGAAASIPAETLISKRSVPIEVSHSQVVEPVEAANPNILEDSKFRRPLSQLMIRSIGKRKGIAAASQGSPPPPINPAQVTPMPAAAPASLSIIGPFTVSNNEKVKVTEVEIQSEPPQPPALVLPQPPVKAPPFKRVQKPRPPPPLTKPPTPPAYSYCCKYCSTEYVDEKGMDDHVIASHCDKIFTEFKNYFLTDAQFTMAVDRFFSAMTYSKRKCDYCRFHLRQFDNFLLRKHFVKDHFKVISEYLEIFQRAHLNELRGNRSATTTYSWSGTNNSKIKCNVCFMEFPKGQLELHKQAFGCILPNETVPSLPPAPNIMWVPNLNGSVGSSTSTSIMPFQTSSEPLQNQLLMGGGNQNFQLVQVQPASAPGGVAASGLPQKRKILLFQTTASSSSSSSAQPSSSYLKKVRLGEGEAGFGGTAVIGGIQQDSGIQFVMLPANDGLSLAGTMMVMEGQMTICGDGTVPAELIQASSGLELGLDSSSVVEEFEQTPTIISTYSMANIQSQESESRSSGYITDGADSEQ